MTNFGCKQFFMFYFAFPENGYNFVTRKSVKD